MKITRWILSASAVVAMTALAAQASAAPITPEFTTFGTLAGATFGGSGIPNDAVAITTISDGGNTITLGLTATQRFANPELTNDGSGTFFAEAGGDTLNGRPDLAKWNFGFYVDATGGSYLFELLYDLDPGSGTDSGQLGSIPFASNTQGSENLGFAYLDNGIPGFVTPPAFGPFNPGASGEYSFVLVARDLAGVELGRAAINVNTAPEPASMTLIGLGALGLMATRRRRKN